MKKLIAGFLALGVLLTGTPSAQAHAVLVDSFPKAKSVLASMPAKVWLEFDGNLTEISGLNVNRIQIADSSKRTVPVIKSYVGGARITAELGKSNSAGKVTISWRVVSEDGHPVTGSIFFYVNAKKK